MNGMQGTRARVESKGRGGEPEEGEGRAEGRPGMERVGDGVCTAVHVRGACGGGEGEVEARRRRGTHLKSIISTSFMPRTIRISCFAPLIREPMMVSFRRRLRPSSGPASSRKL